jgi:chaperonin cofactor prefoldin
MSENQNYEAKYKELSAKRETLVTNKMKVDAELAARKRALRDAMEECKKMGFNPDTLAEDIKKMKEVLNVKLSVFEADLVSAEEAIKPLLKEIG